MSQTANASRPHLLSKSINVTSRNQLDPSSCTLQFIFWKELPAGLKQYSSISAEFDTQLSIFLRNNKCINKTFFVSHWTDASPFEKLAWRYQLRKIDESQCTHSNSINTSTNRIRSTLKNIIDAFRQHYIYMYVYARDVFKLSNPKLKSP